MFTHCFICETKLPGNFKSFRWKNWAIKHIISKAQTCFTENSNSGSAIKIPASQSNEDGNLQSESYAWRTCIVRLSVHLRYQFERNSRNKSQSFVHLSSCYSFQRLDRHFSLEIRNICVHLRIHLVAIR